MGKVITVFGAGTGLGGAIARRFGKEGYKVALIGRRKEPLDTLVAELGRDEIEAAAFPGDLSDAGNVPDIVAAIRERFGRIDAVYYAPNTTDHFVPAFGLTVDLTRQKTEVLFLSLVAVVNEVLPEIRQRGEGGAILAAFGGSAAIGMPYMSGPGPSMAAARNYLYSLHGELAGEGIRVGMLTIRAIIKESAYHRGLESGEIENRLPPHLKIPFIDPAELAGLLWDAASGNGAVERDFPTH